MARYSPAKALPRRHRKVKSWQKGPSSSGNLLQKALLQFLLHHGLI